MIQLLRPRRLRLTVFRNCLILLIFLASLSESAMAADPSPIVPAQPSVPAAGASRPKPANPSGVIHPNIVPPKVPQQFEGDPKVVEGELDRLVEEAISRNPDLAAARYASEAAAHRVPQAGVPDDPYVGYRMKDLPTTFSMTRENATEKQAEVTLRYPFPGKLSLRQAAASKQADVTRAETKIALLRLITEVRLAFVDIFVTDKDIQLAVEQRRMLQDLRDIATSKYRLGPGLQQDVLNADVALARIDTTLIDLSRRRQTRLIRLEVLLNRPSVQVPPLGTLPPAALRFPMAELEEMALAANPEIQRLARAVERDTLNERLAQRAPLPDVLLYAAYGSRQDYPGHGTSKPSSRPDLMTGQIMFDIPIFYFSKQREQLYEALATLNRTRARLTAGREAVLGSLHDLLARLSQHEQVALSYQETVVPLARSEVSAAIHAYQVDRVDFLTLVAAQDNLEKDETAYWHNEADRFRDLTRIDEVTGGGSMPVAGVTR